MHLMPKTLFEKNGKSKELKRSSSEALVEDESRYIVSKRSTVVLSTHSRPKILS